MSAFTADERRQMVEHLFTAAEQPNKSFTRSPDQAEHYEQGYKNGQDAGFLECLQILQDMIDNSVPGTHPSTVAGLIFGRDEIARVGAVDLDEAA